MSSESFSTTPQNCSAKLHTDEYIKANAYEKNGNTPLISAVLDEDYAKAQKLIKDGAEVDACNSYCNTALMFACYMDNLALAVLLVDNGADTNLVNYSGETALFNACSNMSGESNIEIVKYLLAKGAKKSINITEHIYHESPLSIACAQKNRELADLLISNGANLIILQNHQDYLSWIKNKRRLNSLQPSDLGYSASDFFPKPNNRGYSEPCIDLSGKKLCP